MLSICGGSQGKFKPELRPSCGVPRDCSAQRLNPLPHSAESVAFSLETAPAIILNFEHAISIVRRNSQQAVPRLCVTDNIGHTLAHYERGNTLLRGRHFNFGSL